MARSRGQIRKRGENKFLVRIYLGRVDGKRKYTSKVVNGSREDAEKKLTEMLRKKDRGVIQGNTETGLDEFVDEWLETKKDEVAPATLRNYRQAVRAHIKPELGHLRLDEINSRLVQSWINDLNEDLSPGTVRLYHTVLRQALGLAVKWEMIPHNPADGERISLPKQKEREYRIFTKEEVQEFLNATRGDRFHALWHLLFATGLRPQEALGLKWSDLEDGFLHIQRVVRVSDADQRCFEISNDMKTKRAKRRIKLPSYILPILDEHRARQARRILELGDKYDRRGFMFDNGHGRFADPQVVRRDFDAALEAAGLPSEIRLYDVRHTHISHLIIDGVDLKKASHRAGHSTIKLTADTYAHLSEEAEQEMADTVDRMYGKAKGGAQ